ncbi:MAG TPA: alkaline phosphatase family protein [Candidatus Acidoferrales bacterium]|nr:alkaline phosphatase family protein [Candidatus Acidoferrales bacterium]
MFCLMLENRSFDHLLGFSGITGTDAASGSETRINGLNPLGFRSAVESFQTDSIRGIVRKEGRNWPPSSLISVRDLLSSNIFGGQPYRVTQPADFAMPVDPSHEFCGDPANNIPAGVLQQLCGPEAVYPFGGAYPPILNNGFVSSYVATYTATGEQSAPGEIMKCYICPTQLPVLNKLAQEFVVCDNWHASMPGPTWPNRFFAHAASSGGLDHSPSAKEILQWNAVSGFEFKNGTIFDRLDSNNTKWRIYAGDDFPVVGALEGIDLTDIHDYDEFAQDVAQPDYSFSYTFIEPNYGHFLSDFKCGTSEHPKDDITRGEALIKATYDALRNSPLWSNSLLIITWDEHGGFYDHLPPPAAVAPGDTAPGDTYNQYGFTFEQLGPRVPAVVISPLIPRNLIDHRLYDHASIPATVQACFGLRSLTQRDANANNLMSLVSLASPRGDAVTPAPSPASSNLNDDCDPVSFDRRVAVAPAPGGAPTREGLTATRTQDSINEGNVPGFLFVVLRHDMVLSPPGQRAGIMDRFSAVKTRADAAQYVSEVRPKVRAARDALARRL